MPVFRKVSANREPEYIVVHGSDSEPELIQTEPAHKRHKSMRGSDRDQHAVMNAEMARHGSKTTEKNAHLKGRRRYNADLEDLKEEYRDGLGYQGYRIKKFRVGDDEGSIELGICNSHGNDVLGLILLVSDTSDYPKSHSFFSYSNDADLPPHVLNIVESISSWPSQTIWQTVQKVLTSLARPNDIVLSPQSQDEDIDMEDDESSDYEAFDEFDTANEGTTSVSKLNLQKIQNDFVETVATGYRPGVIHFGGDDFAVSISLPVIALAQSIPPRALMAWDRRLLSRSQHLTLLISGFRGMYPPISPDGTYGTVAQQTGTSLTFKVGLSKRYKPGMEHAKDAGRTFGLILEDAEDELRIQAEKAAALEAEYEYNSDTYAEPGQLEPIVELEEEEDDGRFDRFSLSSSLESLLDHAFLKVLQLRRRFGLGWAGAEVLFAEMERRQVKAEVVIDAMRKEILLADEEETKLSRTNDLPHDPLLGLEANHEVNLPLAAFCYLIRRLSLCTRYCIVCHNKLNSAFEALKPYVCDSKLCAYQYYSLNRGPSLEYEIIHNPQTVDLLVSIAHSAASEGVMEEPLPTGLGLRVPVPDPTKAREVPNVPQYFIQPNATVPTTVPVSAENIARGLDGLCDFDDLSIPMMRASIVEMIDSLPAIEDMKKHLEKKVKAGRAKPKLRDMDSSILPAAWSILRWCVASCTAYLEEITSGEESIKNMDPGWRQFRFSVGAPDAEAKFKAAITDAQAKDVNALSYPSLYAFHGSPLRNWHSIIRHGLWYKQVAHGRAYGHGVYLAKEGNLSMGSYAQPGRSSWRKSRICPSSCVALAEIVNLPKKFVSHDPHFVIKDTHWIVCRYLLVKGTIETTYSNPSNESSPPAPKPATPQVTLDPAHPITLNGKRIEIPEPSHQIDTLLKARQQEYCEEDNDEEDVAIFVMKATVPEVIEINSDDEDYSMDYEDGDYATPHKEPVVFAVKNVEKPIDDWKHDQDWVTKSILHLMPPPFEATPSATMAVQRELKTMLKEQDNAKSLKDLGWYMSPDFIGDNLFQWIVEMHSFDDELPIAKDMKAKGLNSIIFEIRFPPAFPISPPFFRIVTPRFLPFIHGGGGHVTGGGSICMDLLTSDGWLPSYSIAAVLMQIKLAISNLDPRPARLSSDFDRPYGVHEALEGYKRAAATHGWQIPVGIEKLVR
ncbi:hypothetical protein Hypma_015532 [Hypsizygus marmoreus]|uniref:UBC core domain-containing protein n=1 Tax=Hypsizygus marmoreus TaxID=39966 RepID=A0A369K444_HYPMA|nr:hypothetical protein Hypma_015532 [Hypsizygus marmoreus]